MKIVLGIPAKNEEKTIQRCLDSVVRASIHSKLDITIVVCANQCVDGTIKIVKEYIHKAKHKIELIVLDEGNLIEAQRIIVSKYLADIYVFVDADVVIEKNSISELIFAMDKGTYVAYAETRVVPKTSKENLVSSIYRLYSSGELLTKRFYFHGRFFATREWLIPISHEIADRYNLNPTLAKFGGLIVDDIYLSACILKEHGPKSILEVKSAVVYSSPIDNFGDWWKTYRRTQIEVKKVLDWFPEIQTVKRYLYRQTDWQKWIKTSISKKTLWLIYLFMKRIFQMFLACELLLLKVPQVTPAEQWLKPTSTKKDLGLDEVLMLIDIDGTLIVDNTKLYKDEGIVNKVRELISRGTIIGLNTARDTEGARVVYDELQLNGPIIVEQGSLVYLPTQSGFKEFVPEGIQTNYDFFDLVSKSVESIIKGRIKFRYTKKDKLEEKSNDLLIAISDHRKFSSSIYCYLGGKPNKRWTKYLYGGLTKLLNTKGVAVDKLISDGKLHVYLQNTNKISAASIVWNKYYKGKTMYIVGDDESSEYSDKIKDMVLLGVNNSKSTYKSVCNYVAKSSGADGLYELFNYLGRT